MQLAPLHAGTLIGKSLNGSTVSVVFKKAAHSTAFEVVATPPDAVGGALRFDNGDLKLALTGATTTEVIGDVTVRTKDVRMVGWLHRWNALQLPHSSKDARPGFNPCTHQVKSWFYKVCFPNVTCTATAWTPRLRKPSS